jgi:hypothetical protein
LTINLSQSKKLATPTNLYFLVAKLSNNRFENFAGLSGVDFIEIPSSDLIPEFMQSCSEAELASKNINIFLQYCVNTDYLLGRKVMKVEGADLLNDFFREMCNLSLGKIRHIFSHYEIHSQLSLPSTRVVDASNLVPQNKALFNSKWFQFFYQERHLFYLKVSSNFLDWTLLETVSSEIDQFLDGDGDVQFL